MRQDHHQQLVFLSSASAFCMAKLSSTYLNSKFNLAALMTANEHQKTSLKHSHFFTDSKTWSKKVERPSSRRHLKQTWSAPVHGQHSILQSQEGPKAANWPHPQSQRMRHDPIWLPNCKKQKKSWIGWIKMPRCLCVPQVTTPGCSNTGKGASSAVTEQKWSDCISSRILKHTFCTPSLLMRNIKPRLPDQSLVCAWLTFLDQVEPDLHHSHLVPCQAIYKLERKRIKLLEFDDPSP